LARAGLVEREALPVLALPAPVAATLDAPPPGGVRIDVSPRHDDVVAGYGGWMQDATLAASLVRPDDMQRPERRFAVAHASDGPVGCALVWLTGDTVALSGVGVVRGWQGRGIGSALVAAASRLGLHQHPAAVAVWMHATEAGAAVYQRLGFRQIDEHVTLGRRA
jgi:GNAT superfamily N-acetyltransferase